MLRVLTCIVFEEIGVFREVGTSFPPFFADRQRHMTAPHNEAECLAVRCLLGNSSATLQKTQKEKEAITFYIERVCGR